MTMVITVKNLMNNASVRMEIEDTDTIGEIIASASEYWQKDTSSYVLKKGKMIVPSSTTVKDAGIINGDVLEMIPDPEGGSA